MERQRRTLQNPIFQVTVAFHKPTTSDSLPHPSGSLPSSLCMGLFFKKTCFLPGSRGSQTQICLSIPSGKVSAMWLQKLSIWELQGEEGEHSYSGVSATASTEATTIPESKKDIVLSACSYKITEEVTGFHKHGHHTIQFIPIYL